MPLALVVYCGMALHVVVMGSRIVLSLQAIALGGDQLLVGALLSLYGLIPLAISVPMGRWIDRIGVYRPLLGTTLAMLAGLLVPAAFPAIPALCMGALLLGGGLMTMVLCLNNITGNIGRPEDRASNFGWLAMSYSAGLLVGPLIAGFGIDHLGHRAALLILTVFPASMLILLMLGRKLLP